MGKRHERMSALGFHILDLPPQILSDIFSKLPVWSILCCRCVCKTFKKIVIDSYFAQLYISRAPTSFVVVTEQLRLFYIDCDAETLCSNYGSSCLGEVQLQSSSSTYKSGIDQVRQYQNDGLEEKFTTRFVRLKNSMELVNSCNGFLCLHSLGLRGRNLYYICNPILGEFLRLPPPPSAYPGYSAFGFDPKDKQYKILRLVLNSDKVKAELFNLRENSWRLIEYAYSAKPRSSFDPSLNGALHWVSDSSNNSELICSFDLHTDEFKTVAPPSHLNVEYLKKISGISVGVLEGCLCLCYVSEGALFEAWLMNEYGVKESWTRKFTIDINSYCGLRLEDKHRPIGFTSYGDMWLKCDSDAYFLVSYSPKRGSFKVIDAVGITSNFEATPHVLSFVSVREIVNVWGTHLKLEVTRPTRIDAF